MKFKSRNTSGLFTEPWAAIVSHFNFLKQKANAPDEIRAS